MGCEIRDSKSTLVAVGYREGSLYYLDQRRATHRACVTSANIWHRRLGHLGTGGMETFIKHQMVFGLDLNPKQQPDFGEPYISGKCHRLPFKQLTNKRASHPLELVHSDVCSKIGTQSLSGGEYFFTFVDDHFRYVWVYIPKHKD